MENGNQNKWLDDAIREVFANHEHPYFQGGDPRQGRAVKALSTVYNHRYPEADGSIVSTAEDADGFDTVNDAVEYLAHVGGRPASNS